MGSLLLAEKAPSQIRRPHFRGDIQGLRALAILLVVADHAGVPGLRGGFIGVDVFFVISGYLITEMLMNEIRNTGRLDFARFYGRRIRRLLPASSLLILCTLACSIFLLSPLEMVQIAKSALAAAGYVSNGWFLINFVDYFGSGASTNPLLHTWSLSVEEQFYLLWPAVLFFCARKSRQPRALLLPLCCILIGSLGPCIWFTYTHQPVAFFSSPTRAWEFAAGGLATLGSGRLLQFVKPQVLRWMGIGIIVGSGCWIRADYPFPGVVAIIPVVGTVLVLMSGKHIGPQSNRMLRIVNGPIGVIGSLSYSWYLWHWPVLVFGRVLMPGIGVRGSVALCLVSLAMAGIAYAFVENPVRFSASLARKTSRSLILGGGLTATCLLVAVGCAKAGNRSVNGPAERPVAVASAHQTQDDCLTGFHKTALRVCSYGRKTGTTVVVFGDSHAAQWLPALSTIAAERNWHIVTLLKASCPSVTVPVYNPRLEREETECGIWRREALAYIAAHHPSLVLLSNSAAYVKRAGLEDGYARLSSEQWEQGVRSTLAELKAAKLNVALLRDTPRPDVDVPICLSRHTAHPGIFSAGACVTDEARAVAPAVWNAEVSAAREFPNVTTIDLTPKFCSGSVCPPEIDGQIVYRDTNHITSDFAKLLAPSLVNQLPPVQGSAASNQAHRAIPTRLIGASVRNVDSMLGIPAGGTPGMNPTK